MLFGRKTEEWKAKVSNWHPYFTLLPRRLVDGRTAWLQRVERKLQSSGTIGWYYWIYREAA